MSRFAAVKLGSLARAAQSVEAADGVDGLRALVPVGDVASAGVAPIAPQLLERVELSGKVRRAEALGTVMTTPMDLIGGARVSLVWGALTLAEYATLGDWLRDQVQVGEKGGRYAISVEIDGPGSAVVLVRPTGPARLEWLARNKWRVTVDGEIVG